MVNTLENIDVPELKESVEEKAPILKDKMSLVKDVKVKLEVRVGEAEITVDELMALSKGSVLALTKSISSPIELLLDGKVVACGNLVAADDNFGIQITELSD